MTVAARITWKAWTAFEDGALRLAVAAVGDEDWRAVAERFNAGAAALTGHARSPSACNHRWRDVLAPGTARPRAPVTFKATVDALDDHAAAFIEAPTAAAQPVVVEAVEPAAPPVPAWEPPTATQLTLLEAPARIERTEKNYRGVALSALAEIVSDKAAPPEVRIEAARLLLTKGA